MENVAILLEHVDLLDTGDGLDLELLKSSLELGVLTTGALRLRGHLTTGGTLTTCGVATSNQEERECAWSVTSAMNCPCMSL